MKREDIFEKLKVIIKDIIEDAADIDIKENDSMADYGADSLEIVEVVSRLMKETKIKIPRTELAQATNIKEVLDLFESHAS